MIYDDNNVFARILRGELPAHKIYEDEHVLALMDIMPRGAGHSLVIPKTRARNILDVEPEALAELSKAVQRLAKASKAAFRADGVTIHQYNESAGGQVIFHLHFHIIPRFDGQDLKPHSGTMEKPEVLAAHADSLRKALAAL